MTSALDTPINQNASPPLALATFGAGCFWHTEEAFRPVRGVTSTSVGYMGGHFENPCYLDVLSRITGHAEVAQILYDPIAISYEALLNTFWNCHDPTTFNRQGPDRGEQYRSVIFFHTPTQRKAAQHSKANLNAQGTYSNPVVTQICSANDYWLATEDHQQYLRLAEKGPVEAKCIGIGGRGLRPSKNGVEKCKEKGGN